MARVYPRRYPTRAQYLAEAQQRLQIQNLQNMVAGTYRKDVVAGVSISPLAIIVQAAQSSGDATLQAMSGLLDPHRGALTKTILQRPELFEQMNREIALKAQRSTLAALARRQPQRDLPAYRAGASNNRKKRYANGRLRRAIDSPLFFYVDARSIRFINTTILDKEAVHWRRLNFGTRGGAAIRPPAQFRIRWGKTSGGGELIAAAFGLDPDVRPAFRIPPGVWLEPGIFYPMGELPRGQRPEGAISAVSAREGATARRVAAQRGPRRGRRARVGQWTRGIASTNFMDAGVERIAREIGPTYFRFIDDRFGTGVPNAVINQQIQARVPRLRTRGPSKIERGRSLGAVYREAGFAQKPGATYYGSRGGGIANAVARLLSGRP